MISSALFRLSYRRLLGACEDPLRAQATRLRAVLRRSASTAIGRQHHFAGLSRIGNDRELVREFQARLPVRTHRAMREDLDAVYAGDWRRLCPSRPLYFAMTAGSTGAFKYLPVTAEFRREVGRGSLAYYGALQAACPELRSLRAQFLVGSAEGGLAPGGIPQGFASGFNYRNLPWILRRKFALPYWIFTLEDAEDRAYAAGRILVDHPDVGVLSAISPVNLINLRRALERHAERLIGDVAAGSLTVSGGAAVTGRYRGRPDPVLAARLQARRAAEGRLPDDLLFPSLRLLACWQSGNMGYYLDELADAFPRCRCFDFPVSASEGVFAIPCAMGRAGGVVAVTSHFLEFMPVAGGAGASALRADELDLGAEYRLVVTNSSGLYRYDMEDIVRVVSRLQRTPVIEFVARADRQVSVSNERLTEHDVTVAMQAASRSCGLRFPEFLFVPCSDRRYRVLADAGALPELGAPADADLHRFAAELERQLRAAARGYDFERADALLEPLSLVLTATGEFRSYIHARNGGSGLPNAQVKPLHLTRVFDAHRQFTGLRTYAA